MDFWIVCDRFSFFYQAQQVYRCVNLIGSMQIGGRCSVSAVDQRRVAPEAWAVTEDSPPWVSGSCAIGFGISPSAAGLSLREFEKFDGNWRALLCQRR